MALFATVMAAFMLFAGALFVVAVLLGARDAIRRVEQRRDWPDLPEDPHKWPLKQPPSAPGAGRHTREDV